MRIITDIMDDLIAHASWSDRNKENNLSTELDLILDGMARQRMREPLLHIDDEILDLL
jgi:hypothetical protein